MGRGGNGEMGRRFDRLLALEEALDWLPAELGGPPGGAFFVLSGASDCVAAFFRVCVLLTHS